MNINLYDSVVIDEEEETASFILYDFDGKLTGFQQYRKDGSKKLRENHRSGKYFTHVTKGMNGVFGLDFVGESGYEDIVLVVEGVFKSCRFHSRGMGSFATLTNNPKRMKGSLELMKLKKFLVCVPDPDKAGEVLAGYFDHHVRPNKPVDELSDLEVELVIQEAKRKYNESKK